MSKLRHPSTDTGATTSSPSDRPSPISAGDERHQILAARSSLEEWGAGQHQVLNLRRSVTTTSAGGGRRATGAQSVPGCAAERRRHDAFAAGPPDGTRATPSLHGTATDCVGSRRCVPLRLDRARGTRVQTAGVTRVGVLPTTPARAADAADAPAPSSIHRARQRARDAPRERDVDLPSVRIRVANRRRAAVVTTRHARPWRSAPLPGSMRLLAVTPMCSRRAPLYERAPAGTWDRSAGRHGCGADPEGASQPTASCTGRGRLSPSTPDSSGVDDGHVFYDVDWDETFAKNPTGVGKVHDCGALHQRSNWILRYLLDIDLITTGRLTAPSRRTGPTGEHDSRPRGRARFDDQWVRILDLGAALTARTYG